MTDCETVGGLRSCLKHTPGRLNKVFVDFLRVHYKNCRLPSSKSWGERSATLSKYEDTADSVAQVIRNPKLTYLWPHALLMFRDECPPVLLLSLTGPHVNVIEAIIALNAIAVREILVILYACFLAVDKYLCETD
ncbi:hypothetical protein CEXT_790681 [Caerostris extrusa]|uniref:Uncharacterized protein n=1 Tax=Caerostris extrusa TaxID=172846 RepID=A0AAV4VUE8_CAEEX|nr:hypothetical protein CEXT_790681 [Caerostris extrusa]